MDGPRPHTICFTHAWFAAVHADVQVGNVHARTGAGAMEQLRLYDGMRRLEAGLGRVRVRSVSDNHHAKRDGDAPVIISANGIREMLFIDFVQLLCDCLLPAIARSIVNADAVFYRILSAYGLDSGHIFAVAMQLAPLNPAVAECVRNAIGVVDDGSGALCTKLEVILRHDPTEYKCTPPDPVGRRRLAWSCAACNRIATIAGVLQGESYPVRATLRALVDTGGLYCGITVCALGPTCRDRRLTDRAIDRWTPSIVVYDAHTGVDAAFACSSGPQRGPAIAVPPAFASATMPECPASDAVVTWYTRCAAFNYCRRVAGESARRHRLAPVEVLALVHLSTRTCSLFVPIDGFVALIKQAAENASDLQRPDVHVSAKWKRDWWPYDTLRIPTSENAAVAFLAAALLPLLPTKPAPGLVEIASAHLMLQVDPGACELYIGGGITTDDAVAAFQVYSSTEAYATRAPADQLSDACASLSRVGCAPADASGVISRVMRAMLHQGPDYAPPAEFAPPLEHADLRTMHNHAVALADDVAEDAIADEIAVARAGRGLPVNPNEIGYDMIYNALAGARIPHALRNATRYQRCVVFPLLRALVFAPHLVISDGDYTVGFDVNQRARERALYDSMRGEHADDDTDSIPSPESALLKLLALAARSHDDASPIDYNSVHDVDGRFFRHDVFSREGGMHPAVALIHAIRHPFMPREDAVYALALHALETRGGTIAHETHATVTDRAVIAAARYPRAWTQVLHQCVANGQCAHAVSIATAGAVASCLASGLADATEGAYTTNADGPGVTDATWRTLRTTAVLRSAMRRFTRL